MAAHVVKPFRPQSAVMVCLFQENEHIVTERETYFPPSIILVLQSRDYSNPRYQNAGSHVRKS